MPPVLIPVIEAIGSAIAATAGGAALGAAIYAGAAYIAAGAPIVASLSITSERSSSAGPEPR